MRSIVHEQRALRWVVLCHNVERKLVVDQIPVHSCKVKASVTLLTAWASRQAGKQASRQAGKQASRQAGKQARLRTSVRIVRTDRAVVQVKRLLATTTAIGMSVVVLRG